LRGPRLRTAADAATLGLTLPACIVAGYFLGKWGDHLFGTSPVLADIGGLLGIVAAFVALYRVAVASRDEGDADE
jgi:F0F1-type ATP synthase assembly protein I